MIDDILGAVFAGLLGDAAADGVDGLAARYRAKQWRKGRRITLRASVENWTDRWAEHIELQGPRVWTVNKFRSAGSERQEIPVAAARAVELARRSGAVHEVRIIEADRTLTIRGLDLALVAWAARSWGPPVTEVGA